MVDKQTQLFEDGAELSPGKNKGEVPAGPKAPTKKRARRPTKKANSEISDLILLPFSMGSLSRSLAACRVSGMVRGDESGDLQARLGQFLIGFRGVVPTWALSACSIDGGSPVLMAVELDQGMYRDKKGYLEVDPVLPTSVVRHIGFASSELKEDFISRVKQFPDVPLSLFETKVQADAFGAPDSGIEIPPSLVAMGESTTVSSQRVRLSQLGGVIACLRDSLRIDSATDDMILHALDHASVDQSLPSALYDSLGMEPGPIDRSVWKAAYTKIEQSSAREGIDVFRFIEELLLALAPLSDEKDKESLDQWCSFSRAVLEGQRDMPKAYEDSANNALRAVLLFLICKGYAGLRELMSHTPVGPRVRALASALCGLYDRIDRLPRDMKGNSREELDCLSQIIIDAESKHKIRLEASNAKWASDFAMRSEIMRDGKIFVERAIKMPGDLVELFAKAHRQNLVVQYEADHRRFFFSIPVAEGNAADVENLYIEVMDSTTRSRQARFYIPVIALNARGLGKADYEDLLELAWNQCMSIGKVTIGGKSSIAVFGVQLIDTFDQEEFDGLLNRFRNVLADLRRTK